MVEIRWTIEAVTWVNDIYEYISKDNPTAAEKVINGIFEKVQCLKNFPDIGYKY
jgi:plasmid stabilization system protein ParE